MNLATQRSPTPTFDTQTKSATQYETIKPPYNSPKSPVYPKMKDKEPTSLEAISQMTHPYPSTPRPSSQTPCAGLRYFPQNILPDDDSIEQPLNFLPDPPSSPTSPPNTSTPTHREISGPTQPTDLLVFHKFNVTTTTPQETMATKVKNSDLHNSIHALGNAMVDQTMGTLPSPPTIRIQIKEEDVILAHLTLAEANQSVLSQNGISEEAKNLIVNQRIWSSTVKAVLKGGVDPRGLASARALRPLPE
ncbi:hypothetical protein DFH29DRAFT_1007872 [Suillus ampliporus]|nr:hypothetical protein DFH29DRAFT_1007872 [Suillus ampliporus]